MPTIVRKQISYYLDLPEWKALQAEAARQRLPMAELCRRLLQPHVDRYLHTAQGREQKTAANC